MTKGRMAEIMGESRGFGYIRVRSLQSVRFVFLSASEFLRDAAGELSHFKRMRKAVVKNITPISGYDLGDFGKSREGAAILDSVPVHLGRGSVVLSLLRVKSEGEVSQCRQIYFLCTRSFRSAVISMKSPEIRGRTAALTVVALASDFPRTSLTRSFMESSRSFRVLRISTCTGAIEKTS